MKHKIEETNKHDDGRIMILMGYVEDGNIETYMDVMKQRLEMAKWGFKKWEAKTNEAKPGEAR